jgi:hypothetical protein
MVDGRMAGRPAGHDYDAFVSYKSEDVTVVRAVADGLIAAGARVWFAEYEILLSGRERFQERIDEGIRHSAYGLVFTNDRFVGSPYCRRELDELLEFAGPERIMEITLPREEGPHREYPSLDRSDLLDLRDPDEILRRAGARLGISPVERPRPRRRGYRDPAGHHSGTKGQPEAYEGFLLGRPYRIALSGWTIEKDPARDPRYVGWAPEFKYAVKRPVLIVNVVAGTEISPEAQRLQEVEGDRAVYEFLLEYAPHHLGAIGAEARGVHLLLKNGRSQMGLTYFMDGYWTRKVSVIIPNEAVSAAGEFVFTFGLFGSFREYCLMTRLMDDLVLSLTWD